MQTGYVASPDCLRTCGLLGAVSSFSMVQFALPPPVWVAVQPGGGAPVLRSSKFTVPASAVPAMRAVVTAMEADVFISALPIDLVRLISPLGLRGRLRWCSIAAR